MAVAALNFNYGIATRFKIKIKISLCFLPEPFVHYISVFSRARDFLPIRFVFFIFVCFCQVFFISFFNFFKFFLGAIL